MTISNMFTGLLIKGLKRRKKITYPAHIFTKYKRIKYLEIQLFVSPESKVTSLTMIHRSEKWSLSLTNFPTR